MQLFYFFMNYLITKPLKSKGIAALLVFLFWPIGLFYATIFGGIIMSFVIGPLVLLLCLTGLGIIFLPIYFLACLIWAILATNSYNRKLIAEAADSSKSSGKEDYNDSISIKFNEEKNREKSELYQDLYRINQLLITKIISEENHNKQKENILNQLKLIEDNETNNSPRNEIITLKQKSNKNVLYWIISFLLIIILFFLLYDRKTNSIKFDRITSIFSTHSKDKEEIKTQLEKAYFNVMNGTYTTQNISGLGSDGLPFYNTDVKALTVMGLAPFAQFFGSLKLEPNNIDVYEFNGNDNTAKVKYDVTVINERDTMTGHIDLLAKKIGGLWKFDAEKFFGFDKKVKSNSYSTQKNDIQTEKKSQLKSNMLLFRLDKKTFDNVISENSDYNAITDTFEINNLLTKKLKSELTENSSSLMDDYKFYDIGTIKFNDFNLNFFIYKYEGLGDQLSAVMNVCDQSGGIIDSKEIGEDYMDEEVDNLFSITTCDIYSDGRIILNNEARKGGKIKNTHKTKKYFINSVGKVIKE